MIESLVRTAVGPFLLPASIPLDALSADTARARLLPPGAAVAHLPSVIPDGDELDRAIRGGRVAAPSSAAASPAAAAVEASGDLVGVLRHASGGWRLKPNFRGLG